MDVSSRPPAGAARRLPLVRLSLFVQGICWLGTLAENICRESPICCGLQGQLNEIILARNVVAFASGVGSWRVLGVRSLAITVAIPVAIAVAVAIGTAGCLAWIPAIEDGTEDSRAVFG